MVDDDKVTLVRGPLLCLGPCVRFVGVICMAMCGVVLTSPRGGSARIQDVLDTGGSEEHHYLHDKVCSSLSSRPVSCVA